MVYPYRTYKSWWAGAVPNQKVKYTLGPTLFMQQSFSVTVDCWLVGLQYARANEDGLSCNIMFVRDTTPTYLAAAVPFSHAAGAAGFRGWERLYFRPRRRLTAGTIYVMHRVILRNMWYYEGTVNDLDAGDVTNGIVTFKGGTTTLYTGVGNNPEAVPAAGASHNTSKGIDVIVDDTP